ncbi:MAG: lysophospholipid acyltransferase family protein [Alphaproteobacteria bacterium]
MRPHRRIARSEGLRNLIGWLAAKYVRLVRLTGRWEEIGREVPQGFWSEGKPYIGCFWHGRMLMMPPFGNPDVPFRMLISRHPDGQLIARTVRHFGIDSITGSSSKGGTEALRHMVRALKDGACVGITPDGPRGPRMRAAAGIVALARLSGLPIVPATFSASRRWLMPNWDRFVVPLPFCRGVFHWGEPLVVPRDADAATLEAMRQEVENRLNDMTREADRACGVAPVLPEASVAEISEREAASA